MRRSFELARRGLGQVSPNPLVGAVLVKNGKVIGEGHHERHGSQHAEPACFANATADPTGATLYVNLEPCCHTNKLTPPCAPLVIQKKVARVVISNLDPNPMVAGQGVKQLRDAGIDVVTGILEAEGVALNEIFFHRMRTGLPFVHLKAALSLDGKTAKSDGSSKWITGPDARQDSHWGRLGCDAILIGAQTLRADDPSLTVRIPSLNVQLPPYRLVLTKSGKLPGEAKVFNDQYKDKTFVITDQQTKITATTNVIRLSTLESFPFSEFYSRLRERGIHSLWLEGGAHIHDLFLQNKQVQRVTIYQSSKILGSDGLDGFLHPLPELHLTSTTILGSDHKFSGLLK